MRPLPRLSLILLLFALSGFAGLAYQSLWTYYLGLTLGHAAYAQALVLCVYMGGMALGAAAASLRRGAWRQPLLAYAIVEIAIGIGAVFFHPLFLAWQDWSRTQILPHLGQWGLAYQWASSTLWLLPQSMLLGATFPLLATGVRRQWAGSDTRILGWLYAVNCAGAVIGALATTFWLLPYWGVPGAMRFAAALNIAVGMTMVLVVWRTGVGGAEKAQSAIAHPPAPVKAEKLKDTKIGARGLLLVAAITGLTSFIYEIVWVRMLNQILGTTVHSFEIMLATFIAGLALGAAYVARRRNLDALRWLAQAQWWMGLTALASCVLIAHSFGWMGTWFETVQEKQWGYNIFMLGCAALAMAAMLPATFFAGMTLPLATGALLKQGGGESAVGRIYAVNTLGAIAGVLLSIHLLIPLLGLEKALIVAAVLDAVVGLFLFWRLGAQRLVRAGAVALLLALGAAAAWGQISPHDQAAAVWRNGRQALNADFTVPWSHDGKTATVVVGQIGSNRWIATNGKADAAMEDTLDNPAGPDEFAMNLLAAMPLAAHPNPERIGVIGWGSGMTTHMLLGSDVVKQVDTVEIEPAMYEGAKLFGDRVARAYEDPRSRVVFEDARTYFASQPVRYDVIVSEPSNPWVSGVAGLFTQEFYRFLYTRLENDGVLVQWLHAYDLNDPLLATMTAALLAEFPDTELYAAHEFDLVFVSRKVPGILDGAHLNDAGVAREFERVGMGSVEALTGRRLAGPRELAAFVASNRVGPHRDFYPTVALEAPRARFLGQHSDGLLRLMHSGFPIATMFDGKPGSMAQTEGFLMGTATQKNPVLEHLVGNPTAGYSGSADTADQLRALSRTSVPAAKVGEWAVLATRVFRQASMAGQWMTLEKVFYERSWLASKQPEEIEALRAMLVATARQDAPVMTREAIGLLDTQEAWPALAREHLLLTAWLGQVQQRQCLAAKNLQERHGNIERSPAMEAPRKLLEAWIERCDQDDG